VLRAGSVRGELPLDSSMLISQLKTSASNSVGNGVTRGLLSWPAQVITDRYGEPETGGA